MSLKLFNQGYSPEEIKKIKAREDYMTHEQEMEKKWRESERTLNMLRTLKAADPYRLDKMELEIWKKATGLSALPHRL